MGPPATNYRSTLWVLIGAGAVLRLTVALTTDGHADIDAWRFVYDAARVDGLHAYDRLNSSSWVGYPYPPGFWGFILPAARLELAIGEGFSALIRLPMIAADAAIAWLVQYHLGERGYGHGARLLGAGLVALGPSFGAISGYHGQFDSVAILPAVGALIIWERTDSPRHAVAAGALIGLGAAIKTVPLVLLAAVAPYARSWNESLRLVVIAASIPVALAMPFLLAGDSGAQKIFRYQGGPGLGGFGLVADPSGPIAAFGLREGHVDGLVRTLTDNSRFILGAALLLAVAFILRYRPRPIQAACLLWLVVYVFGVNLYLNYLVWGLPFFLLAGYLRAVLALQIALLAPTLVSYVLVPASNHGLPLRAWEISLFYTVPMIAVWVALAAALLLLVKRLAVEPDDEHRGPALSSG